MRKSLECSQASVVCHTNKQYKLSLLFATRQGEKKPTCLTQPPPWACVLSCATSKGFFRHPAGTTESIMPYVERSTEQEVTSRAQGRREGGVGGGVLQELGRKSVRLGPIFIPSWDPSWTVRCYCFGQVSVWSFLS